MKEQHSSIACLPYDNKLSRREMITKALMVLPDQRGTKKEIFGKIESIYNIKLLKSDSVYKTLE